MSLQHIDNPNDIKQCPYDPSHRVSALRLPHHLVRCAQNHPNIKALYVACPFNAMHLILSIDRAAHIASCPDKVTIERGFIETPGVKPKTSIMVPAYESHVPESMEDWDLECDHVKKGSYLDEINRKGLKCNLNAQNFALMPPAEKKQHYKHLSASRTDNESSSGSSSSTNDNSQLAPSLSRMRLPNSSPMFAQPKTTQGVSLGLGRGLPRSGASSVTGSYRPPQSPAPSVISQTSSVGRGRGIGRGKPSCFPTSSTPLPNGGSSFGNSFNHASSSVASYSDLNDRDYSSEDDSEVLNAVNIPKVLTNMSDLKEQIQRGAKLDVVQLQKIIQEK